MTSDERNFDEIDRLRSEKESLLASFKQFLIAWEQWDDGPSCQPVYESIAQIRSAIAKAEGGS